MGTIFSRRVKHRRQSTTDEISGLNIDRSSSIDGHFFEELLPERYLVFLTEQISEILFRLMTANGSNRQAISSFHMNDNDKITDQSLLKSPTLSRSCTTCRMKMLTMEEFRRLYQAFHRVDKNDDDHLLTRDEIHTTLHDLFELTDSDMEEFLTVFDRNEDKHVSLEEYIGRKRFSLEVNLIESIEFSEEIKHRLLHEYTREEIKHAFDQADLQKNGHLDSKELTKAIGYLNLHLSHQRTMESNDHLS